MKLKSMKLVKKDLPKLKETVMADRPRYPYGLTLHLENEAMEKLGMEALPEVGKSMVLMAKVKVESVSQSEREKGKVQRSMSIQITDMALGKEEKKSNPEEKLYS